MRGEQEYSTQASENYRCGHGKNRCLLKDLKKISMKVFPVCPVAFGGHSFHLWIGKCIIPCLNTLPAFFPPNASFSKLVHSDSKQHIVLLSSLQVLEERLCPEILNMALLEHFPLSHRDCVILPKHILSFRSPTACASASSGLYYPC